MAFRFCTTTRGFDLPPALGPLDTDPGLLRLLFSFQELTGEMLFGTKEATEAGTADPSASDSAVRRFLHPGGCRAEAVGRRAAVPIGYVIKPFYYLFTTFLDIQKGRGGGDLRT